MHVAREVVRLAGPAVATSLLQTLVFLADRLILAQHGRDSLASMQINGPVLWSVFSVFLGMTVGTVALVSRHVGAGDLDRARGVSRVALRLAGGLGLGVGLVGVMGTAGIVGAMRPESLAIAEASEAYMRVAFVGFPFVFVATTAAMIHNGTGDTRTPLRAGVVANTWNIVANVVFVFGVDAGPIHIPELGAAGAALGSATAFMVESFLLVRVLRRVDHPASARGWLRGAADPAGRRQLVRLSAPALVERVVVHTGFIVFAALVTSLGGLAMAANQAMITLESFCFLGAEGFGVAAATVVGQSLGRDRAQDSMRGAWIAVGLCVATLTVAGLSIWATSPWTARLFVAPGEDGEALVAAVVSTMPLLAVAQPLMGGAVVLGHALRGAGDTRSPVYAAFLGGLVTRIGGAYFLAVDAGMGLRGIWIASALDWAVRVLILGAVFLRARWKRIQL